MFFTGICIIFYWLKKKIFWKLVYFFRVFFITVPNSKVSLLTFIKLFCRLKLYSVSVCDEPCSPDRTYTLTHTSQKCQDNNMKKKYTKTAPRTPNSCVIQRQGVYDWSDLGIIKHTRGIIYCTAVWFLCSKIRHPVF